MTAVMPEPFVPNAKNLDFTVGVQCQKFNEWCDRQYPHKHAHECSSTCPCWDLELI